MSLVQFRGIDVYYKNIKESAQATLKPSGLLKVNNCTKNAKFEILLATKEFKPFIPR
jgi:hypothetical protein